MCWLMGIVYLSFDSCLSRKFFYDTNYFVSYNAICQVWTTYNIYIKITGCGVIDNNATVQQFKATISHCTVFIISKKMDTELWMTQEDECLKNTKKKTNIWLLEIKEHIKNIYGKWNKSITGGFTTSCLETGTCMCVFRHFCEFSINLSV